MKTQKSRHRTSHGGDLYEEEEKTQQDPDREDLPYTNTYNTEVIVSSAAPYMMCVMS